MVMHYDPDRKPAIEITDEVKGRLQEIKNKHHLKSYNKAIEYLLNKEEKKVVKDNRTLGELTELSYELSGNFNQPKHKEKKKKRN